jgi:hypothetical protein
MGARVRKRPTRQPVKLNPAPKTAPAPGWSHDRDVMTDTNKALTEAVKQLTDAVAMVADLAGVSFPEHIPKVREKIAAARKELDRAA